MDQFQRDRLEALRSLDEGIIRAYGRKYAARFPGDDNPEVFWRAVSAAWLREHGSAAEGPVLESFRERLRREEPGS